MTWNEAHAAVQAAYCGGCGASASPDATHCSRCRRRLRADIERRLTEDGVEMTIDPQNCGWGVFGPDGTLRSVVFDDTFELARLAPDEQTRVVTVADVIDAAQAAAR